MEIIAIDDDPLMLHTIAMVLEDDFGVIQTATHPDQAQSIFQDNNIKVVLLDLNFSLGDSEGEEGLAWIKRLKERQPNISIIVITAHGLIDIAVKALKQGASDFIEKPFSNEKLISTVRAALNLSNAQLDLSREQQKNALWQKQQLNQTHLTIGRSEIMQNVMSVIERVASTDASVLITGDHGTGKELLAKELHLNSLRVSEPFVQIDLNAITASLFESTLFGHVKGAFTDASEDKAGMIETANFGTLFLDEIGSIPMALQAKLLSVLQRREVQRVGEHKPRAIDVRVISATHQTIDQLSKVDQFRQDLLYRINTVHIHIPPLRDRKEDILPLAEAFLRDFNQKYSRHLSFNKSALKNLESYHWPGNVRELKNSIERMVIMNEVANVQLNEEKGPVDNLYELEKEKIEEVLTRHKGNITHAANELGIGRNTLYRKMKKYAI